MNKRLVQLLIAFVIFFVLTSPSVAGPQARSYFGWLGDGIEAVGVFAEGLFTDTSPADPAAPATPADPAAPPSP